MNEIEAKEIGVLTDFYTKDIAKRLQTCCETGSPVHNLAFITALTEYSGIRIAQFPQHESRKSILRQLPQILKLTSDNWVTIFQKQKDDLDNAKPSPIVPKSNIIIKRG